MRTIKKLIDLSGRRALIAGGAGFMGLAIAETLVELGARVAIMDLDSKACERRARELSRRKRGAAISVPCDLAHENQTRSAAREAVSRLGGLDILVHAVSYRPDAGENGWSVPLKKQTVRALESAVRVNLVSAFVLAQEAGTALSRSGRGSVILIGSIYGMLAPDWSLYAGTPLSNPVAYGASKGALLQTMRYLATELAPRVRVNAISPGGIRRGVQPAAFLKRYAARTPLGRLAFDEDIKGAIAYLAGDLSRYVTGHNLAVDGGWSAW